MNFNHQWFFLFLPLISFQVNANLISNGGFEDPVFNSGATITHFENQADVPGWNTTAPDSEIEFWEDGFGGFTAFAGRQFIELNANVVATVFQDISAIAAGQQINFSFAHHGREGIDTVRFSITDLATNNILFTQDYNTGDSGWAQYDSSLAAAILATGNPLRIAFESIANSTDQDTFGNFIDAVEVTAVPLPPSLVFFLLGLSSFFFTKKRLTA